MRLSSIISLAVLALPILLHSPGALSAEPTKDPASSCGTTANEAVAAAEKAILDKSADSQARAIICLIQAVRALEATRLDTTRGDENARMLRVPRNP